MSLLSSLSLLPFTLNEETDEENLPDDKERPSARISNLLIEEMTYKMFNCHFWDISAINQGERGRNETRGKRDTTWNCATDTGGGNGMRGTLIRQLERSVLCTKVMSNCAVRLKPNKLGLALPTDWVCCLPANNKLANPLQLIYIITHTITTTSYLHSRHSLGLGKQAESGRAVGWMLTACEGKRQVIIFVDDFPRQHDSRAQAALSTTFILHTTQQTRANWKM